MSSRRRTFRKNGRVTRACENCQKAHLGCGQSRPCRRCRERGLAAQCRDVVSVQLQPQSKHVNIQSKQNTKQVMAVKAEVTQATLANSSSDASSSEEDSTTPVPIYLAFSGVYNVQEQGVARFKEDDFILTTFDAEDMTSPSLYTRGMPQIREKLSVSLKRKRSRERKLKKEHVIEKRNDIIETATDGETLTLNEASLLLWQMSQGGSMYM